MSGRPERLFNITTNYRTIYINLNYKLFSRGHVRSIYLSDQAKASGEFLTRQHTNGLDVNLNGKVSKRAVLLAPT